MSMGQPAPAAGFNTSPYPPLMSNEQQGPGYPPMVNQSPGYPSYPPSYNQSAPMPPGAPITQQPGGFPPPSTQPHAPQGLEYLTAVDQLLVQQQVELAEVLFSFETQNKYQVKNSVGQQVYFATEDTNCCNRNCLGAKR